MSTPNDGGPAFPVPTWPRQADGQPMSSCEFGLGGMTLLDYFASQALIGILANQSLLTVVDQHIQGPTTDAAAKYAYGVAEAMLKAREQ